MMQKRATSVAFFILTTLSLGHTGIGLAQEAVYRCGEVITNDAAQAKREKCRLLESGAVVTIPSTSQQKAVAVTQSRSASLSKSSTLKPKPATTQRSAEQQARDHDSKAIIQSELKKTEAQLVDLRRQYAGLTAAQDLERKLALKQQIARNEADIQSLMRELKR
jgi:hypothetical protein